MATLTVLVKIYFISVMQRDWQKFGPAKISAHTVHSLDYTAIEARYDVSHEN